MTFRDSTTVVFIKSQLSVVYFLLRSCFRLLVKCILGYRLARVRTSLL